MLQVPRSANDAQIKRAYRKLALKMHPDKVQGSEEEKKAAAQKFADVSHGGLLLRANRTSRLEPETFAWVISSCMLLLRWGAHESFHSLPLLQLKWRSFALLQLTRC